MDEAQIQEWVDQLTGALQGLRPEQQPESGFWDSYSFAPMVTLGIGLAAAIIAVATLFQKSRSDARSEWWRRTQWAVDAWLSEDPERRAQGKLMFGVLTESKLAGVDEAKFLNASKEQLDRPVAVDSAPDPTPDSAQEPSKSSITRADMEAAIRESNPNLSESEVQDLVAEALDGDMDETPAARDNESIKEEGR